MSEKELTKEQVEKISQALDRVVSDLPWKQSVFLSALGKKFEKIRDEFKNDIGKSFLNTHDLNTNTDKALLKPDQKELFVAIYNAQGQDLGLWAKIIYNLTNQFVSRPIYMNDSSVKEMIRSKVNLRNEGYVSIYVYENDFLDIPEERRPKDKLGNLLCQLKERVITEEKINKFYHESGIYEYKNGILSRLGDMAFNEL